MSSTETPHPHDQPAAAGKQHHLILMTPSGVTDATVPTEAEEKAPEKPALFLVEKPAPVVIEPQPEGRSA